MDPPYEVSKAPLSEPLLSIWTSLVHLAGSGFPAERESILASSLSSSFRSTRNLDRSAGEHSLYLSLSLVFVVCSFLVVLCCVVLSFSFVMFVCIVLLQCSFVLFLCLACLPSSSLLFFCLVLFSSRGFWNAFCKFM